MAAIIYKGFGDCSNSICQVLTVPCKLLEKSCSNPFFFYVIVTLGLNVTSIILGIPTIINDFIGCTWLSINTIFCVMNIGGAFYLAWKYQEKEDSNTEGRVGYQKVSHILCYDRGVALYILEIIAYFVWLILGQSSLGAGDNACKGEGASIGLGFSYFAIAVLSLFFGVFCSCFSCCCCCKAGKDNNIYRMTSNYRNPSNMAPTSNTHHDTGNLISVATPVSEPVRATVVEPSPLHQQATTTSTNSNDDSSLDMEAQAAALGITIGGKIGSFLNISDEKRTKLETGGAKASVATQKMLGTLKKNFKAKN